MVYIFDVTPSADGAQLCPNIFAGPTQSRRELRDPQSFERRTDDSPPRGGVGRRFGGRDQRSPGLVCVKLAISALACTTQAPRSASATLAQISLGSGGALVGSQPMLPPRPG